MSNTELQIGPLFYQHQVQAISIVEQKATESLNPTRTGKNFVADSGQSLKRAEIRLLFSNIEEINGQTSQIGNANSSASLRELIALFKCAPIISVRNEMISRVFKPDTASERINRPYEEPEDKTATEGFLEFVPVALEELNITNVPDLPLAMYATLIVSQADVSYATSGELLYQGLGKNSRHYDPSNAYWLKIWIGKMMEQQIVPYLTPDDFTGVRFDWYGQDILGASISSQSKISSIEIGPQNPTVSVQSESCSIRNLFSYHNLIGRSTCCPQHMGSTSRYFSIDIVFNEQSDLGQRTYKAFNIFKEAADEISRSKNRENRIVGWNVKSPITKLLNVDPYVSDLTPKSPFGGIFVPLNIIHETTEQPFVKTVRADFVENNVEFFKQNEVVLDSGGTDYDSLKKFYDTITRKEYAFRQNRLKDPNYVLKIAGQSTNTPDELSSYSLFWPVVDGEMKFGRTETFGLLTKETIKAVFLHSDFDVGDKLNIALSSNELIAGQLVTGPRQLTVAQRLKVNWQQISGAILGPDSDDKEYQEIYRLIYDYMKSKVLVDGAVPISEDIIKELSTHMFFAFFGDYEGASFLSPIDLTSESGTLIQKLAGSSISLHRDFKETLFKVIIERKTPPQLPRPAYSLQSIQTSFFKLLVEYSKYANTDPNLSTPNRDDESTRIAKSKKRSLYPDLILPSYIELYGLDWTDYAPTYSDFGIINSNPVTGRTSTDDPQIAIAVSPEDIVSPAAWFFSKKFKPGLDKLLEASKSGASIASAVGHKLTLSVPFEVTEIPEIEKLLEQTNKERKNNPNYANKELTKIISEAFKRLKDNGKELEFAEDMRQLRLAASENYREKLLNSDSTDITIRVYQTTNDNASVKRGLTVGGLGAELYRVASEFKWLKKSDRLPELDQDQQVRSVGNPEFEYIKNLDENTQRLIKSSIDQLPDTFESPTKLFPACKVYLLEDRGTDLVGDDSFFTINPVISIDITLDKDDPDLAVIVVADPLFTLQRDTFPAGNITNIKGTASNREVLGSLKNMSDGYLKRFKITQGRAIQIKMGYDSNPENLKTIFTGRIAEIQPGDQLTIVAQGWKAELVNRQIAFSNSDPKNWGAKDLVVQAIQTAEPEGFGEHYPQRDANFIIKNLGNIDSQELVKQVLTVQEGASHIYGTRGVAETVLNSIVTTLGLQSRDKENIGLDTRLKNIWYPEIPDTNNFFGIKSMFSTPWSHINDSWTIPLQPCWDVLKEAARHTWGSIIQVVPFDGKATIFFGDPSQPYYFTKGNKIAREHWTKYLTNYKQFSDDGLDALISGFKDSVQYLNLLSDEANKRLVEDCSFLRGVSEDRAIDNVVDPSSTMGQLIDARQAAGKAIKDGPSILYSLDEIYKGASAIKKAFDFSKESVFGISTVPPYGVVPSYKILESIIDMNIIVLNEALNKSSLPYEAFLSLQTNYLKHRTTSIICKLFYGINEFDLTRVWPSASQDIETLLKASSNESLENIGPQIADYAPYSRLHRTLFNLNRSFVFSEALLESEIPSFRNRVEMFRAANFSTSDAKINSYVSEAISIANSMIDHYQNNKEPNEIKFVALKKAMASLLDKIASETKNNSIMGIPSYGSLRDAIKDTRIKLKVFTYWLNEYLRQNSAGQAEATKLTSVGESFPPTMQIFRVHHNIDSYHDIIKNDIVASTRDMWNTVSIEYPARDEATSKIDTVEDLYRSSEFYSGIKWIYWPKSEVTGVIGLQFHPGLTLSNKKLKIFTELNCQSEALAAKLAFNRLAEGIRKMYRGSLLIKGRHIKPYDRIILNDDYNNMAGPLEVESVVHHWSIDKGWVCNIIPEAVCTANPGSSILQTAALEGIFNRVFRAVDVVADALTIIAIVSTLGAGSGLASGGNVAVKKGIRGLLIDLKEKKLLDFTKGRLRDIGATIFSKEVPDSIRSILTTSGVSPLNKLYQIFHRYLAGPGAAILKAQLFGGALKQLTAMNFRLFVTSAFAENAQKVEQLPVILSPLLFNGVPFLAGLETDDPVWSLYFNDVFLSLKDLQQGAEAVLENLVGNSFSEISSGKTK